MNSQRALVEQSLMADGWHHPDVYPKRVPGLNARPAIRAESDPRVQAAPSDMAGRDRCSAPSTTCRRCHGDGTIEVNDSLVGDPQMAYDAGCPDCRGRGDLVADAEPTESAPVSADSSGFAASVFAEAFPELDGEETSHEW